MKNPSPHYPLVQIEWTDAFANSNWMDEEEFNEWKKDHKAMTVHDIGWLMEQDKDKVIVASRFNESLGMYGLFQMIPKTWVKIIVLAKPKKKE